jgi:hypothetical protein
LLEIASLLAEQTTHRELGTDHFNRYRAEQLSTAASPNCNASVLDSHPAAARIFRDRNTWAGMP